MITGHYTTQYLGDERNGELIELTRPFGTLGEKKRPEVPKLQR